MAIDEHYGYEPNYELDTFDPNIYQGYDNTCAIRSQEIILRDYGIMLSQDELIEYATQNGWFNPDPLTGGTDKYSVGNILDACGIQTTRVENASVNDIIEELKAGHRIIVSVDANELWIKKEGNPIKRFIGEKENQANDALQHFLGVEGANHALIVAGVNVDTDNPDKIEVVIIDPGTGDVCVRYSLSDFEDAWNDGNRLMITTNIPAPYQYNYTTHQMEPSGFNTDYLPSMAVILEGMDNQFCLADSYYTAYADYIPSYGKKEETAISESNEEEYHESHLNSSIDIDEIVESPINHDVSMHKGYEENNGCELIDWHQHFDYDTDDSVEDVCNGSN